MTKQKASRKNAGQKAVPKNPIVLDIPYDQILPDPHQPRTHFDAGDLSELKQSMEDQGPQQFPVVNFAYRKDGKDYYYIKAGERRWRAHGGLGYTFVRCVVAPEIYTGEYDIGRVLAQASENSSRVPHTHCELISLVEKAVAAEIDKDPSNERDAVRHGIAKVAKAMGKVYSWAERYHKLSRLDPSLRKLLDQKRGDVMCLNIVSALKLVVSPTGDQQKILAGSEKEKVKGGHAAAQRYIMAATRDAVKASGRKVRGRKPSDKKRSFETTIRLWIRQSHNLFDGLPKGSKKERFVGEIISKLTTIEVDQNLAKMEEVSEVFQMILKLLRTARKDHYEAFGRSVSS